jgi:hypothetical protein
MKPLEETPAGVADYYTELIKASRAHEVRELENSPNARPVKHILTVVKELVVNLEGAREK